MHYLMEYCLIQCVKLKLKFCILDFNLFHFNPLNFVKTVFLGDS